MFDSYFLNENGYESIITDHGFAYYKYHPESNDFFIGHFFANKGKSFAFFEMVKNHAKSLGAQRLVGNLFRNYSNDKAFTRKVMVHLGFGYKIIDVTDNCITVMKEI